MLASSSRLRRLTAKKVAQAAVLGALAAGTFGLGANAAVAQGATGDVYNCYTQWWNTAWAQKCYSAGAEATGTYESTIDCSVTGRRYLPKFRRVGSTTTYPGVDCTFSASNGDIYYY
ncbi:hypothetical protein ACFQY4_22535 [Catellatospora bangladeshensis]|uniref:Uncharacterized protein n=1 Tax=Catellatospora bangladeshensis TaxID=310355 RepID=A0A8J3JD15_9ACTN|nr:hypothetical protein [Catellatospora bangladeshensis]GIF80414.1 hypothetical protein Cba03nite_17630 [Catellatospora bangladeshensis]